MRNFKLHTIDGHDEGLCGLVATDVLGQNAFEKAELVCEPERPVTVLLTVEGRLDDAADGN